MLSASGAEILMIKSARVRLLLLLVVAFSAIVSIIWILQSRFHNHAGEATLANPQVVTPPLNQVSAPSPVPSSAAAAATNTDALPTPEASPVTRELTRVLTLDASYVGRLNLAVPVKGVKREQLLDTFEDARSEGRFHDAIDIPAPAGTPVIAAAEGEIIKLFQSDRGGITIYQASVDKKLVFYYAHLQGYAEGLVAGKRVWQGETIGYVGDTGNAGTGNYHLHFSIMITNDPKRYWEGTNINPYPLLRK